MKLIHCADLHLDSRMGTHLPPEKARARRQEILRTFERMVDYAAETGVQAILIAGDLFDTKAISAGTKNVVLSRIANHPDIRFYYLRGNHDRDNFLTGLDSIPENLKLFSDTWQVYEEGRVRIAGIELEHADPGAVYASLVLPADTFNIVMLHGQETESGSRDKAEIINLRALRGKQIDYLALGHIHTPKTEKLDARGIYCYPGCLEGRGFDECGPHGFMLLDIPDGGEMTQTFVPFAYRTLHALLTDISGCLTSFEIGRKIDEKILAENIPEKDLLRVILTGQVDVNCEKNLAYLSSRLSRFYYAEVQDASEPVVRFEDYANDRSLKGEFFRTVMADASLSEQEQLKILEIGFRTLAGEEP